MIHVRRYSSQSKLTTLFKLTMSSFGSQAMILTSASPKDETFHNLHGMTLSSVCSLSILPKPLMQFNLHLPSYTSDSLHRCGYLALHILPPTPNSVKLGRIFSKGIKMNKSDQEILKTTNQELKDGEVFHEMTKPFEKLSSKDYSFKYIDNFKLPILSDSEKVIICKTEKSFNVDNHEIWIVHVLEIIDNLTQKSGGLLYFNRGFYKIGESLLE